jgi:hypothetical protein
MIDGPRLVASRYRLIISHVANATVQIDRSDVLGDDDRRAGLAPPLRCAPMTHDPTHDAETDAIVAELEKVGLVEVTIDDQGGEMWTLISEGERVGNMLAMVGDEDQRLTVITDLLDDAKE